MELQECEIITYDGMMNNDKIRVYSSVDVIHFIKLYEIDNLNILNVMITLRAVNILNLYALYRYIHVSVGNGKVRNKGIYIHGLSYVCNCLRSRIESYKDT